MQTVPLVSMIIPAYNEERHIGRAVRSALNQNFPRDNLEIIVVNDASSDRTRYALDIFGSEIKVLHNETQLGLPGSLNRAIKAAHGKYIVRLDGDDFVSPEYVRSLYMFLEMNSYMDAVACDYVLVDEKEDAIERRNCLEHPIGCGIMFRVDHLIDIGMYDDNFLMHEDQDLRIRFLKRYNIHRVELPLYRYRRHDGNMTRNEERGQQFERKLEAKHGETEGQ